MALWPFGNKLEAEREAGEKLEGDHGDLPWSRGAVEGGGAGQAHRLGEDVAAKAEDDRGESEDATRQVVPDQHPDRARETGDPQRQLRDGHVGGDGPKEPQLPGDAGSDQQQADCRRQPSRAPAPWPGRRLRVGHRSADAALADAARAQPAHQPVEFYPELPGQPEGAKQVRVHAIG